MAEQHTNKLNRWAKIGFSLILIANIVLLIMMWQARIARIEFLASDVSFFTSYFSVIAGATLGLVSISSILLFSGQLVKLAKVSLVWLWIFLSIIGLLILNVFVAGFSIYLAPFLFWLIIVDCALLLIAYHDSLAKMNMAALARNATAMGFGIFVTLLMLEILLRVYFGFMGTEGQKAAYLYSASEIIEVSNRYAGRPYINYGLVANHPDHNSRAYRGAEFSIPKVDGTYRIFALGGSTTYGDSIPYQESYPALLQTILHEDYGYTHIEVVNAGVNAYSSFDSLANLTYHVLDDEPNMVIVYHGVNDVRARLVNPIYYSGANIQRGYWNTRALENIINPSVLIRFSSIQLGFVPNPNQFETILGADGLVPRCGFFETVCSAVDNRPAAEIVTENPPIYFERNFRNIAAIARANDVDVIYSTWQYYSGELDLPNPMSLEHMQAAVDEQNALLLEFAADLDIPVMDFANNDTLDSPEFWIDGMHLTALGTYEQAAFYAAYLIENDLLPPPPAN